MNASIALNFTIRPATARYLMLGLALAAAMPSRAAERVELDGVAFPSAVLADERAAGSDTAGRLGLQASQLAPVRSKRYANGTVVTRYQQFHQGVPIWGDAVIEHRHPSKLMTDLDGALLRGLDADLPSVAPALSATQILAVARAAAAVTQTTENDSAVLYVTLNADQQAALTYLVSFNVINAEQPSRPTMLIDAHSGAVLEQWEGLTHFEAGGPGGNQKTGQYEYSSDTDPLIVTENCTMQSENVIAIDLASGVSGTTPFQFECPRNTYQEINGAYSPINDAYFFAATVFAMYSDYLNVRPIKQTLQMRVHYGRNYENAFWNGSSMSFGDGADHF